MKRALVLLLSLIFCLVSVAQDSPRKVQVDQQLLEATEAIENEIWWYALYIFQEIERTIALDYIFRNEERESGLQTQSKLEPPPEFLFLYGKLLVEHSFVEDSVVGRNFKERLDGLLKGQLVLKEFILHIEKSSEDYKQALDLLLVAEEVAEKKVNERQQQFKEDEYATQQAALRPIGEMVSIPGGIFFMGGLYDLGENRFHMFDKPVNVVRVKPFKLGKYEVTFAQWDACVADGGCRGYWPSDEGWGRGNRPVINVSWDDAQLFIDWLNDKTGGNYRLPTEAEWEYAARAGSMTFYSWGDELGVGRANCDNDYCGDQWEFTAPVGSFAANAWGLHDMLGNVWEWVQDCLHFNYENVSSDGSAWTGSCHDYKNPHYNYNHSYSNRVVRGGSWSGGVFNLRYDARRAMSRVSYDEYVGFRLAQDE